MVRKTGVQSQVESYQRLKKKKEKKKYFMLGIKGEVEKSWEWSSASV